MTIYKDKHETPNGRQLLNLTLEDWPSCLVMSILATETRLRYVGHDEFREAILCVPDLTPAQTLDKLRAGETLIVERFEVPG